MKNVCSISLFLIMVLCVRNYSAALYGQNGYALSEVVEIGNEQVLGFATPKLGLDFFGNKFLNLSNAQRFSYINPNSSELSKNLYSQNIALVLFATATRGNSQPISFEKTTLNPYITTYIPSSSTRWYVGDRLFAVDNSAFFGIEFDSSFAYKSGVIRIGDSSEKAFVILVSLNPPKR
ncbi:hypothetical protein [Aureispira sp. CCB-E]|uniref:hypothetical protein n=1 Tax=Aureispira sp. CCB-E TaxID=3051121 RepID=UPI002868E46A|nr:hypothetical protein [Aureispira sp. CCB-E]WMX15244.1 hypothetical protein QP953_02520 [Aureispira sp. CCB-E]